MGGAHPQWATSSPPPIGNFAALPEITSEAPLYDARYAPTGGDASGGPADASTSSTEASG